MYKSTMCGNSVGKFTHEKGEMDNAKDTGGRG